MPFWQCKCVTFFLSWGRWSSSWNFCAWYRGFKWTLNRGKHVAKKKWSTSVLNATLHVTYNLIVHLCRLLRKAIENNWIHSKSSRTGIILHFHQQPSDENLIINAKWNGVKRRDWDHIPGEFPTAWLFGHHLGSQEMLLQSPRRREGSWIEAFYFLRVCLCSKYEGE